MLKNLKCIECSSMNKKLFEDVRSPPLDIGDCLCSECHITACEQHIEELEEQIDLTKEQIQQAR